MKEYGYSLADIRDYEEDHVVRLFLARAPRASANLWPQPRFGGARSTCGAFRSDTDRGRAVYENVAALFIPQRCTAFDCYREIVRTL